MSFASEFLDEVLGVHALINAELKLDSVHLLVDAEDLFVHNSEDCFSCVVVGQNGQVSVLRQSPDGQPREALQTSVQSLAQALCARHLA